VRLTPVKSSPSTRLASFAGGQCCGAYGPPAFLPESQRLEIIVSLGDDPIARPPPRRIEVKKAIRMDLTAGQDGRA